MASSPTSAAQTCLAAYHGMRMTEDEYLFLPEDKPYLEYIDGWVLQKPMGDEEHGALGGEFIIRLGAYRARFGGRLGPEMRARFPEANYRLPDVSYYTKGMRFGAQLPPTLAVEIRSPGQTHNELRAKCRFFGANGVDECWLVDPRMRTVELFSSEGEFILGTDQTLDSIALPGFELALGEHFAVLDPEA
ncbi:MAG: Uma2 family endonuclease [Anaerolineaceae bacterium]